MTAPKLNHFRSSRADLVILRQDAWLTKQTRARKRAKKRQPHRNWKPDRRQKKLNFDDECDLKACIARHLLTHIATFPFCGFSLPLCAPGTPTNENRFMVIGCEYTARLGWHRKCRREGYARSRSQPPAYMMALRSDYDARFDVYANCPFERTILLFIGIRATIHVIGIEWLRLLFVLLRIFSINQIVSQYQFSCIIMPLEVIVIGEGNSAETLVMCAPYPQNVSKRSKWHVFQFFVLVRINCLAVVRRAAS